MQIAVCDDEKAVRDTLAGKINRLYPEADIHLFCSGKELLMSEPGADIVFLDIQMPDMDGMETAKQLRIKDKHAVLIFVTAMEEYVFQAFDVGAFHYIVKPFEDEKFSQVLKNAVEQAEYFYNKITHVSERGNPSNCAEKYFMVKTGGMAMKILISDIVYAEVFNRKVTIHTVKEDIEYYGRLSDLEKQAGADFFRTHRAYLVNFKHVMKYNVSTVWLTEGSALMAKQNYHEFVKRYLRYNQRYNSV